MTVETTDGFGEAEERTLVPSPLVDRRGSTAPSAKVGMAVCQSNWAHTAPETGIGVWNEFPSD